MTDLIALEKLRPHDLVRAVSKPFRLTRHWPPVSVDAELELLHRPSPKPPVGTVLTGKQVKSRMWKRGTKFCYVKRGDMNVPQMRGLTPIPLYSIVELTRDGLFVWSSDSSNIRWITDDSEFILVYRPEEESDKQC